MRPSRSGPAPDSPTPGRRNDSPASSRAGIAITVPGVLGTILVFSIAALCARLGFWQLDRLEERRTRNAALAAR
ncbi:MAG TPA: SURF1 family cytochrome oxidase biogenesis protein, partial [Longimicrobiales bacterium]|nr:SURF1 family cytochrome oxidase biogenesis protein [Longimicrobiales bacterium]